MNQGILTLTAALLTVGLMGTGQAQTDKKPTTQKCGNYTVTTEPVTSAEYQQERITLKGPKGVVYSTEDWMVETKWCKDVTGDGIPEVDLLLFSGGAHCCFSHKVYSLTTPPRLLLQADTAHTDALDPRQLDGKGPFELVTADWRFAYGFGMSFAESVALPEVYSYVNGHYVVNTRAFPALISSWFSDVKKVEDSYSALAKVSELLLLGKDSQIDSTLRNAPADLRNWITGYLPDIREYLSTLGYNDYPVMAGVRPEDNTYITAVGSFTTPGSKQVLSVLQGSAKNPYVKAGQLGVVLIDKTSSGFKVTPTGLTLPRVAKDLYDEGFNLDVAVKRSNGLFDVVVRNSRSGSQKLQAYRMSKNTLVPVKNDALDTALKAIQDLHNLSEVNEKIFDKTTKRTPAQLAALMDRANLMRQQGKAWTPLLGIEPEQVGEFDWYTLQFLRDTPQEAQIYVTLDYGTIPEDAGDYGVFGKRYGMTLTLQKDQNWKITSVDMTRLKASPYDENE
ncbi:hypothetical protein [Deinococcus cellulosilyticus]|uniref:Uncharacterized protein n=1 Tax=Deinococcus cellulosilyticus (strain DSM 18568 / NBRC 106333 / KACC 11606 / 5516J-15) TaxID=1223518 RepID=A0A511N5S8_DEIC1|nr:hypothetical protein [Deinococcus cellulosilyticus]GEM48194.1 hypothetical protein DC3_38290 [Deinococcus cellulosilyticus NBRC 106333 = KACC 11606]